MGNSLGVYYTPQYLGEFLVKWAVRSKSESVLDPACGDGAILLEARKLTHKITGVEIDPLACRKSRSVLPGAKIINSDFFKASKSLEKYDCVVSNPPFIRSNLFSHRNKSESSWALFLKESMKLLKQNGKLAFILPREFLFSNYSQTILKELKQQFDQIIIYITNFFAFDAQTRVTLLLAAKSAQTKGLFFKNIPDPSHLNSNNLQLTDNVRSDWLYDIIPKSSRSLMQDKLASNSFVPLSSVADIRLGIVTGAKEFFLLSEKDAKNWNISTKHLKPVLPTTQFVDGTNFTHDDFNKLRKAEKKCFLLSTLDRSDRSLDRYIKHGENNSIHLRYKCRIREPWYMIKHNEPPDGFLTYMVGRFPKIIKNSAGVLATNNLHFVKPHETNSVFSTFYNWVTLTSVELIGRIYGGGVLKIEPKDAQRIVVPKNNYRIKEVDTLFRKGSFFNAVDYVSSSIGIKSNELKKLRLAWSSLQNARTNLRKKLD